MVGKMDYIQQMTAARKRLTLKIQKYQNALDQLPEGSLRANKNGSSYKYYQVIGKERRYLPQSEKQLIGSLAKKRFLSAEILDAEKEIKAIDLFLRNHQTDSVTDMLLARENGIAEALKDVVIPDDVRLQQWASEPYPTYDAFPQYLIHKGPFGRMYRSKTEADIAFLLVKKGIPFRYEWIQMINGTEYPIDFTIRHPKTGQMFFWEHLGLMDKGNYTIKLGSKFLDYESAGIFPGVNLILTFESKKFPINSNQLEEIIDHWFF